MVEFFRPIIVVGEEKININSKKDLIFQVMKSPETIYLWVIVVVVCDLWSPKSCNSYKISPIILELIRCKVEFTTKG